ncbi:MAG: tetratricopeptide repeat protein [Ferrovibrio sp.]|jgi:tetratricopeptide (TPR) repeat protein|uniref:tetratricopeptide repeat protein n=1 Tax=Ferrovibrio sp. TaxID=1917215 RepID=UPI00391AD263
MSVSRILPVALLAISLSLLPGLSLPPAHAAGSSEPAAPAKPVDPNFTEGRKAIDAKDFNAAIPLFQAVVAKDAQNADAYNWLGYAYRNLGNYEQSFANYNKALQIDPRHRGAHEYIGEAYLKTNQLEKAEEHLKRLDSLCLFGCAEYTELKNKIAAYKAGKPS